MEKVGYHVRTTDGVIGTSGTPKDIFGYTFLSGGGGAGAIDFHDGTGTTGTKVIAATGTTSKTTTVDFGGVGVRFVSGCYINLDANVTSLTVFYKEVQ